MSDDLFPHATAQAPELERARQQLAMAEQQLDSCQSGFGRMYAQQAVDGCAARVTQLEAEAMRKEGR